jgi:hypothetical protein
VSFFDEDDEPRRTPRPRSARRAGSTATADSQTLLLRRGLAMGALVVVLLIAVFGINACLDSRRETALKNYNTEVGAIGQQSAEVGGQFFQLMRESRGGSPQDLQTDISSFRVQAEQQLDQAENLDVPGEMTGAHRSLLIALEARRDGLDYIASHVRDALGDEGEAADRAINEIAGQMEVFLASDVLYRTRVIPFIDNALREQEIGNQRIVQSQFLPDLGWLEPEAIASVLDQQLTSGDGRSRDEPTGPGLHGTGIDSVSYGDTTLQPDTANQLTYDPGTPFTVRFTNQGENEEFEIRVTVRIAGGGRPITLTDTVDTVVPGAEGVAEMALDRTPPLDSAVEIRVQVAPVPGEEKTDNNRAVYPALFSRG